jgi:hypothetical protein
LFSGSPIVSPGVSRSTTNALIPRWPRSGSVLANTTYRSETPAFVIHDFVPRSTYESPSRTARVLRLATSLPASGSERQ